MSKYWAQFLFHLSVRWSGLHIRIDPVFHASHIMYTIDAGNASDIRYHVSATDLLRKIEFDCSFLVRFDPPRILARPVKLAQPRFIASF